MTEEAVIRDAEVEYQIPFPLSGALISDGGRAYRTATKGDCFTFRNFADSLDGFTLEHSEKDKCVVWSKEIKNEPVHVIKATGFYRNEEGTPQITPELVYDMLQDPRYRMTWDTFCYDAFKIARLDERNEVSYYAGESPVIFVSGRDFVNQRAWHPAGDGEYVVFNTSVPHVIVTPKYLEDRKKKKMSFVRGISKVTGYLIQSWRDEATGQPLGVALTYVTQTDIKGSIPTTVVNYLTKKVVPKTLRKLEKAIRGYITWKEDQEKEGSYTRTWDITTEWWNKGDSVTDIVDIPTNTLTFIQNHWKKNSK